LLQFDEDPGKRAGHRKQILGPSLALGQDAVDCLLTYKALLCTYSKGTKSMTHIVQGQA